MFIFQEVKSKDTIIDHVVVAWSNLVNYTQSYVLSGSFTEKFFKKITQLLHISKIRYNFALAKGEEQCPAANCLVV